jgi:hypothetical protein
MTPEEYKEIKNSIRYDFMQDNYFNELKEAEILRERMATLRDVEDHVGVYYSREWVIRNILQLSEDDSEEMKTQMEAEKEQFGDPNDQEQQN